MKPRVMTASILLAFTVHTRGDGLAVTYTGDGKDSRLIQHSTDKLVNRFSRELFSRTWSVSHLHHANLDNTMLGKKTPIIYQPPMLDGTTILITGANTGLGLESAKRLAQAGAKVIMTARTQAKADAALAEVKAILPNADITALVLDLADLKSVRRFPRQYRRAVGNVPIDVLMENAGVMAIPERITTADGFEMTVGTNHLGHFALVAAMLPTLRKAAHGFRIIVVSSDAHKLANEDSMKEALATNLDPKKHFPWRSYGISKAANILFANELQRRFDAAGIPASAISLHPGMVQTHLVRYLIQGIDGVEKEIPLNESFQAMSPIKRALLKAVARFAVTVEQGANTQVYLAAAADSNGDLTKGGGQYFVDMHVAKPKDFTNSTELASKLWEVSEILTRTRIKI